MHQPRHRTLVIRADRQDIAVRTHGDDWLLQCFGVGWRGENLVEGLPGPCGGRPHLAADIRKIGGCTVGDFILCRDCGIDPFFQILIGPESVKETVDAGFLALFLGEIGLAESRAARKPSDVQQFPCVQRTAEPGSLECGSNISRT